MIDGLPVGQYGPTALCGIFVLLIFTGWMWPWRMVRGIIRERDHWHAAAEELLKQNSDLIAAARTGVNAVETIANTAAQHKAADR